MPSICLALMAKNEAHVLPRALLSAKPYVHSWLVLDTGSTDGTPDVARATMGDLPGEVVSRPWRGFDGSRSELLELARPRADYTLILDADDTFEAPANARFPDLTEPGYALMVHDGPLIYPRIHLVSNAFPWRYVGAVHEAATCDGVEVTTRIEGLIYRRLGGGARSLDPETYRKDAALLEADLQRDPTNARSVFYLARSYEDAGELPRALAHYERRAFLGGWPEEVFYALYSAAVIREKLRFPRERVAMAYLEAWNARPHRAEPIFRLAVLAREAEDWERARSFAAVAQAIPFPRSDTTFIHHEVYAWRALDEYANACAKFGDWDAAVDGCRRLLARDLPAGDRARVLANLASCDAAARAAHRA